ncbi:MAG: chemotaxis protein CheD [Bacillota bacterium]|nr:chemotaxis protein CheD [Bacillota bacterium]
MERIVGIGEMAISNNIEDTIKTFALASCVGVVAYSPQKKVGGMLHFALPHPLVKQEPEVRSCYYASIGIPYFIHSIYKEYGCLKNELIISLYGGASSIRNEDIFHVGEKNLETARSILNNMNIKFDDIETGRKVSRTIQLNISTGKVDIAYQKITI